MNDAIVQRNRRAVYHALSSVLKDPAAVTRALDIWEANFSDQRGFRVNLFVNAVAQVLELNDAQVRALASGVYAAMTTPEKNLPQLPTAVRARSAAESPAPPQPVAANRHPNTSNATAQVPAERATTSAAQHVQPQPVQPPLAQPPPVQAVDVSMQTGVINPRLAVFTSLLAALIDGVTRAHKFDEFLESMDAQIPAVAVTTLHARTVWINGALTRLRQFVNIVPDAERRTIVNDVYVAICDACGPVAADRILSAAVQATEQTPEARFSSPRSFL